MTEKPTAGTRWLVITSSFPRCERDVAGLFVQRWCEAIAERGHRLDVLAWRGREAQDRRFHRRGRVRFVSYAPRRFEQLFFGAGAPENIAERPLRALLGIPAVAAMVAEAHRLCRRHDYDGIVGHWLVPGGLIARAVAASVGCSSAVIGHSGGTHLLRRLPRPVARPLADVIAAGPTTVPTGALLGHLLETAGGAVDSVQVAPMGFRPVEPNPDRETGERLRIGFLGRLVPIKGLPVVFRALKRLDGIRRRLTLEVVGDGPCRDRWRRLADDRVVFVGARFGDEKREILQGWDGFVLPSMPTDRGRHEGLPVSMLEAASAGAIPLVSGIPGVSRWLASSNDQIVDGGVCAWAERLRWFAELDGERRAELRAESRRVVRPLAWPNYGAWWERWLRATACSERPSKTA